MAHIFQCSRILIHFEKLITMSEKERITQPTSGSNKPGTETTEKKGKGVSAGTDTQTRLTALNTSKNKKAKNKDDKKN